MLFAPSGPQGPRRRNRTKAIFFTIFIVLSIYFLFFAGASPANTTSNDRPSYAERHGATPRPKVPQPTVPDELARPAVRKRKEIVVASMKSDDTSWLAEYFTDWSRSVYVVDDQKAALTVTQNKGRESMVYLT